MSVDQPPEGPDAAERPEPEQPRPAEPAGTAVQGRPPGRRGWIGAERGFALAPFLGWFSVGLGTLQLLAPRTLARAIGLEPSPARSKIIQACGVRELAAGVGILANPTAKEWLGVRLAGDLVDLGLLAAALAASERRGRTLAAVATVAGVTLLDAAAAEELAERRKTPAERERGVHVVRSITVERPIEEVYACWRDFSSFPSFMQNIESVELLGGGRSRWRARGPGGTTVQWEAELVEERENERLGWRSVGGSDVWSNGTVRFARAHGGGTVVTVELEYAPPGGRIGAALLKPFRREPGQLIADDLRRFKQLLETGEVLVSDASAERRPRAARPPSRTLH